jgi:predicted GNAT family acetyltransferase
MTHFDIQHDPTRRRFLAQVDGYEGAVEYRQDGDRMEIVRTTVPEAIGGRGIAAQLVKSALDFAGANKLRVTPTCSYAATYIRRHPEYADLVD